MTTVTSSAVKVPGPGRGTKAPEDTSRRANNCSERRDPDHRPGVPGRRQILSPTREAEQTHGTSAHQNGATVEDDGGRVHGQTEARRQRSLFPIGGAGGWAWPTRWNPWWLWAHRYLGSHGCGSATLALRPQLEEAIVLAEDQDVHEAEALADDDVDDLMVEEISIDGMCGVY